jgi:hypothetical protein
VSTIYWEYIDLDIEDSWFTLVFGESCFHELDSCNLHPVSHNLLKLCAMCNSDNLIFGTLMISFKKRW